jgi:hypothetical protein
MGGKDGQIHADSAEGKNECRCTATTHMCLHDTHRNNLKQTYVLQMISWPQVSLHVLGLSFCCAFTFWFLLRCRSHLFCDFLYLQLKLHILFFSGVCTFFLVFEPCDTQQGHISLICYVSGPSILNTHTICKVPFDHGFHMTVRRFQWTLHKSIVLVVWQNVVLW